ncbi:unnamed protein product [Calypogeia fissa]
MHLLQFSSSSASAAVGGAVRNLHSSIPKQFLWVTSQSAPHLRTQAVIASGFVNLSSSLSVSPSVSVWGFSVFEGGAAGAPAGRRSLKILGGRKHQVVCMAAGAAPVEVLVKAAVGQPDQLGDCPFSQRVLLTLEEKGVPYEAKYIDTSNKPAWFLEANPEGKVPVIKDEGKWVADSDVITELLEQKFPDPPLAAAPAPVGGKLFGAFVQFLVSKDENDGKEEALLEELKALNEYLKEHGPYLNVEKISALDLALAPKLYHLKIALGHYKKWSIPEDLTYLNKYIENVFSRESFVKTKAPEAVVVKGWEAKVKGS